MEKKFLKVTKLHYSKKVYIANRNLVEHLKPL